MVKVGFAVPAVARSRLLVFYRWTSGFILSQVLFLVAVFLVRRLAPVHLRRLFCFAGARNSRFFSLASLDAITFS